jgi:hypothetical protein
MKLDICIDVDDIGRAVRFYGEGIGLTVVKQEPDWAQLRAGEQTIWIMKAAAGDAGAISRDYRRHWAPVHLDFQVEDLEKTIAAPSLPAEGWRPGRKAAWQPFPTPRETAWTWFRPPSSYFTSVARNS